MGVHKPYNTYVYNYCKISESITYNNLIMIDDKSVISPLESEKGLLQNYGLLRNNTY